ncbi:hypothetical protein [Trebonia kvetii]|uniref:hypothetical protein n=1 Tax=Trebonia kvetii TaxID=2480626 RepID=UPI001C9E3854|nr:hypothetical protein [Trebonia kvetii]
MSGLYETRNEQGRVDPRGTRAGEGPVDGEHVSAAGHLEVAGVEIVMNQAAAAQQSVDASAHSHARGRVHRLATLATVLAGQRDAENAAGTAMRMLDHATGMESRRIHERIVAVRDAITSVSDGRASAELAERVTDMTGAHLRAG